MPKQRLTDRQFISGVTLTDLLHFVVTGDTSQSTAGSSYKGSVEQLFNGFSSYTCTYPLIVDTVNSCSGEITINGNVTINGSATTINTEVIQSKDNNIVLNYSGTHLTAIGGGITLEDGVSDGVDSRIFTDSDGTWLFDPELSASSGTILNFTADTISVNTIGNSGDCVNDIYVTNIHSCSPLNINPLDEGNIYFGSTSGVTIDVINSRLGIGITTPDRRLVVSGDYATFYVDTDRQDPLSLTQPGERVLFVGNPSGSTRISISTETNVGVSIGQVGSLATNPNLGIFGNPYDSFIRSNSNANNLNIITSNGGGKEDSIRFYAKLLGNVSGSTSSLHIQGSGSTKGYIGINNDNPTERLDVSGNTKINGTLNISTLGTGTTISNLGIDSNGFVVSGVNDTDTIVTGFTYSNNNFTISQDGGQSDLVANISTMSGLTINGDLNVNGQTIMSASGQSILTIIGSGNTNPLFTIQGSSGELFSVTDSLVGSLFSVNDISGLPILEVFDDDTILMGNYQAPSLNTTVLSNPSIGLSTIYSVPMSAYTGAWFEYTVKNTSGVRAGQIMSIFSGNTVNFTEITTTDIGTTSDITFNMSADSTNSLLQVSATTVGWEVKTIVRSI